MYKKTIKRGERNFDYYIYVDYSENLIGYIIIERNKIEELIPKISRFRHYRQSKNRKIYLKHINDTIKKEKIYSSLLEFKIKEMHESIEVYANVLDFVKRHDKCVIFISIDDKLVSIINDGKTVVVKESDLKRGTVEYQMSLIIDNALNVERRQRKKR